LACYALGLGWAVLVLLCIESEIITDQAMLY